MSFEIKPSISDMASSDGSYRFSGDLAVPEYVSSSVGVDLVRFLTIYRNSKIAETIRMNCRTAWVST